MAICGKPCQVESDGHPGLRDDAGNPICAMSPGHEDDFCMCQPSDRGRFQKCPKCQRVIAKRGFKAHLEGHKLKEGLIALCRTCRRRQAPFALRVVNAEWRHTLQGEVVDTEKLPGAKRDIEHEPDPVGVRDLESEERRKQTVKRRHERIATGMQRWMNGQPGWQSVMDKPATLPDTQGRPVTFRILWDDYVRGVRNGWGQAWQHANWKRRATEEDLPVPPRPTLSGLKAAGIEVDWSSDSIYYDEVVGMVKVGDVIACDADWTSMRCHAVRVTEVQGSKTILGRALCGYDGGQAAWSPTSDGSLSDVTCERCKKTEEWRAQA